MAAINTAELWERYLKHNDRKAYEKLIEHYMPIVNIIAGRMAISLPPHVEREDLISSGYFGLLDAASRFDPAKDIKFETYAGIRVKGAMLDYLRSKDWVSPSLRSKIRNYEKALYALENELGEVPTEKQLADYMGLSVKELRELKVKADSSTVVPLETFMENGGDVGNPVNEI